LKKFTIKDVVLDRNGGELTFTSTENVKLTLQLTGSCCSRSYFDKDAVADAKALIGSTLTSIESSYISSDGDDNIDVKTYALLLRTSEGSCSLMWHNSSNGYYSGDIGVYLNGDRLSSYSETDTQRMKDLGITHLNTN